MTCPSFNPYAYKWMHGHLKAYDLSNILQVINENQKTKTQNLSRHHLSFSASKNKETIDVTPKKKKLYVINKYSRMR